MVAASPYVLNFYSCYHFRAFGCLKVLHSSLMRAPEHCAFYDLQLGVLDEAA